MFRQRIPPLPLPSKIDSLSLEEVSMLLETSLGESVTQFRDLTPGKDRDLKLAMLERHLDTALAAARSMRRR